MAHNQVQIQVMVIDNLNKILRMLIPFYKTKKIIKNYIGGQAHIHLKYEDNSEFLCIPLNAIKKYNIQISKLWIDKDLDIETINQQVLPKYVGRKEDITWI